MHLQTGQKAEDRHNESDLHGVVWVEVEEEQRQAEERAVRAWLVGEGMLRCLAGARLVIYSDARMHLVYYKGCMSPHTCPRRGEALSTVCASTAEVFERDSHKASVFEAQTCA